MSIRWMTKVWDEAALEGTSLLLLLCIADHAQDDTARAWPTTARLAQRVRRTERQVQRILAELEAAGWIRREQRPGRSTMYYLLDPAKAHVTPDTHVTPDMGVTPPPTPMSPITIKEPPLSLDAADSVDEEAAAEMSQLVTPEARPFPVTEQRKLVSWFGVTDARQVEAWVAAWSTAESFVVAQPSHYYDPEAHLAIYLSKCREEKRAVRSDLWLRFYIEDRAKHRATLEQQEERAVRAEEDPQQREDRQTRALPPAEWGVAGEEQS